MLTADVLPPSLLTFMSMSPTFVEGLVDRGQLVRLQPRSRRASRRRALLASEGVMQTLETAGDDWATAERLGRLRADLEVFVTERNLYPKYLFWLHPRNLGVWEIRSVEEQPTFRVLGRFMECDAFVALTVERRDDLKGWNSPEWKRAIRTCVQRWNTIFNPYLCHIGSEADDFFSGAISGQYFKR